MPPLSLPFTIAPGALAKPFDAACARLDSVQFASALWSRRLDVWTADPAVRQLIANRLGWLGALEFLTPLVPRMRAFADSVAQSGFTDIVLLGMGGSSLAPEVLRQVLGRPDREPRFRVLDSVDPDAVRAATSGLPRAAAPQHRIDYVVANGGVDSARRARRETGALAAPRARS